VTKTDRAALRRAIALVEAESDGRRQQIARMLKEDGFERAGCFAAYHRQTDALRLKPWEWPPCWTDEQPTDDRNGHGLIKAWQLRQRLLAAGLSVYEPDPIGALAVIEARPAPAA
jgi:hypothetical protein